MKIVPLITFIALFCFLAFEVEAEQKPLEEPYATKFKHAVELIDQYAGDTSLLYAAKKELDEIVKKYPEYAPLYKEAARFTMLQGYLNDYNFEEGTLEKAEKLMKKSMFLDPNFVGAYVFCGHFYRMMDKYDEALACLKKAEKLGTDDPWYYNNSADILQDSQKYEAAAVLYQKVIDSNTKNKKAIVAAFEGLRFCYRKLGNLDKSEEIFKKTIEFAPDSAWNYGNYGQFLLCRRDDYDASIVQMRKALDIMPYGMGEYFLAAALYRKWAEGVLNNKEEKDYKSLAEARSIIPDPSIFIENEETCPTLVKIRNAISVSKAK